MPSFSLSWESDGFIDGHRIYRSTSTIDVNSLPVPIADNLIDKSFVDSAISANTRYYYRVSSFKGVVEKLSEEVVLGDKFWSNVVLYSRLNSNATDLSEKLNTPTVGGAVNFQSAKFGNGILCNGTAGSAISYPASNFAILENQDFTIEGWVSVSQKPTSFYYSAFGNWSGNTGICFFVKPSSGFQVSINQGYIVTDTQYSINDLMHIAIVRKNGLVSLYVNGQLTGSITHSNAVQGKTFYLGGNGVGTDWWRGLIDEIRVTIGVARYANNFTPQDKEFYTF